jgi:urease accessory protein
LTGVKVGRREFVASFASCIRKVLPVEREALWSSWLNSLREKLVRLRIFAIVILSGALVSPVLAHPAAGQVYSFGAGLAHPFTGADHILAMLAVGLWGVLARGRAIWLWPSAFVATMLVGFAAASMGLHILFLESAISASVVVLGLCVALAIAAPIWVGAAIVGLFAFFHGFAHGIETPTANTIPYVAGFALATSWIHSAGIGLGLLAEGLIGRVALRVMGALTVLSGVFLIAS